MLAHPGESGEVGYLDIYKMLREMHWREQDLTKYVHVAYAGRGKTEPNILPCWIYGELFRARNDFMHGEPIALGRLVVSSSGQNLFNFSAPLHRACLTSFLGLSAYGPTPEDNEGIGKALAWRMHVNQDQNYTERALLRVFKQAEH
jgi:hypothetical protein